jgi:uncharacterized protein (DUF1697 family)
MPRSSAPVPHAALLRGVNVGGNNLLPMKDLAAMFVTAGCVDVQTYIQSGNVIFKASRDVLDGLAGRIEKQITARFGFRSPVILRTAAEIGDVIRNNPFLKPGADEKLLHVLFLADSPDAARAGSLDPDRSPPDAFTLVKREIYLHVPNGAARTKLTNAYFDSKLATVTTGRNWRTVLKLWELLENL